MKVVRHKTAKKFLDRASAWLCKAEAENNLIIGICSNLSEYPERLAVEPYLLTVEHAGALVGAAVMTPPRKLVITRLPSGALHALAEYLLDNGVMVPSVLGPKDEAKAFAEFWPGKSGKSCRPGKVERIYDCEHVIHPSRRPGHLRPATDMEQEFLAVWLENFRQDADLDKEAESSRDIVRNMISDKRLYVWEDGEVLSVAGWTGETPHGVRVTFVYTPTPKRRNGYATSCGAALTRLLLESGKQVVFLYTDLTNRTSNSIYQQIGYQHVCDCQDWFFSTPPG